MTELKSYPLPELEALAERIKAEILKRELEEEERLRRAAADAAAAVIEAERQARVAAEAAAEARRKAEAEAAARVKAEAEAEAAAKAAAEAALAPPKPPRYMHPSNRALVWSGEGPRPEWIAAWLTTGGTLYALEVAAEKLAPRPIPGSFRIPPKP